MIVVSYSFGMSYESAVKDLDRSREIFTALIAHDLRNPIHAISLQTQIYARQAKQTGEVSLKSSDLDLILRNTERLSRMAYDLLDVARLQTRQLRLSQTEVDLKTELSNALNDIKPTLGAHPLNFVANGASFDAWLDPVRFHQIIANLLSNAAKYSPEGAPIDVTLTKTSHLLKIAIRDRGPGIAKSDIAKLFDRFFRTKEAEETREGMGLGLYITKGLVEGHGGRIWVESEPGKGSTFLVAFHAAKQSGNESQAA